MRNISLCKGPGIILFLAFSFLSGYSQDKAGASKDIALYREKQEATFMNAEESPLLPADRKKFKGLKYFPIDLAYRVQARLSGMKTRSS